MHGNVLRRQTLLNDPLHLIVGDRRKRSVIAVQKRQPYILVPDEQRRSSICRIPFAEAKKALVRTLPRNDLFEVDAKILAFLTVELDVQRLTVRSFYAKCQFRFTGGLEPEIQVIADRTAVDLNYPVCRTQLKFIGQPAG